MKNRADICGCSPNSIRIAEIAEDQLNLVQDCLRHKLEQPALEPRRRLQAQEQKDVAITQLLSTTRTSSGQPIG